MSHHITKRKDKSMRRTTTALFPLLVAPWATEAFVVSPNTATFRRNDLTNPQTGVDRKMSSVGDTSKDCGCAPATTFSGNPSESAKSMNSRSVVNKSPVYRLNGEKTTIGNILGDSPTTSLVVFLRSLG